MEYPVGLVCLKCGETFGTILNPGTCLAKDIREIKTICTTCIERLRREKDIIPQSPEDWARLLEGLL